MALGDILRSFPAPSSSPLGMGWDGRTLWLTDFGGIVYQLGPRDGTIMRSFVTGIGTPRAVTFGERALWYSAQTTLYQLDPRDGTILQSFPSPAALAVGLSFGGRSLWLCDTSTNTIYQLDPRDGTILRSFPSPTGTPEDVAFDESMRTLWHCETINERIYQLDPRDGTILRSFVTPSTDPRGITIDGRTIWLSDNTTNTIYQLSLQ